MGTEVIKNLDSSNIFLDHGKVSMDIIDELENTQKIRLPRLYVNFIVNHNGADINARIFDYDDPNRVHGSGRNADALAFVNAEEIQYRINNIKSGEEPDWPVEYRFEDGLIPFGDNGGGDMICFDYRKDKSTNNPPIVIWNHDMGLKHRVVFIANSFEEFINMLHEPED